MHFFEVEKRESRKSEKVFSLDIKDNSIYNLK